MSDQVITPGVRAGLSLPDYELLRPIGRGAYGEVWLARNVTGSWVALKVVHRSAFDHDRPFEREFEGIKRFEPISRSDSSQVAILHVGLGDGFFYYVMELADEAAGRSNGAMESGSDGTTRRQQHSTALSLQHSITPTSYVPNTLKHEMRTRGHLPSGECLAIALSLTRALAHLHGNGLVHRDVKPSNVIFVNGQAKLADIGLVTSVDATRSFVGTEGYLPSEGAGTPQADLYSLGKVLYEMSTGCDRKEFPALPPDIATRPDRETLAEINAIVVRACQLDPRERYTSAEAMLGDLELLQRGRSVKRQRALDQRWAACRKTSLIILALAVPVAATFFFLRSSRDQYLKSKISEVNGFVEEGNYELRGVTHDRLTIAAAAFNKALALDPTFVPAWWGLCQAAIHGGGMNGDAAAERNLRAAATKLTQIAPSWAESRLASSCVKWVDWDFRGALADARLATQTRAASIEGRAAVHILYGYCLLESGNPAAALEEDRIAVGLYPAHPHFHDLLGMPYFVSRQFDEALKYFRESLIIEPRQSTAHVYIGRVYEEKQDFAAAIQEFQEAELLDSRDQAKVKNFYSTLREAVRNEGGHGYWSKQLELALVDSPPNLYYIATLYARLGNKPKAYDYLNRACEMKAFKSGLLVDLCWDHDDPEFQALARRIGLLR